MLILTVSGLFLNEPSLRANESEKAEAVKSSSPSPPPGNKQKSAPKKQSAISQRSPSPPAESLKVVTQPTPDQKQHTSDNKAEQSYYDWFWPPVWSNWALILVAMLAARIALRTLSVIERQAEAARVAAAAALEEAKAITLSERAYVKMSHRPPGLKPIAASPVYEVHLQVKNFGRTPATVTSVVLAPKILSHDDPLPTTPEYTPGTGQHIRRIFLVREDEFFTYQHFTILSPDFGLIENGTKDLCIYGYVDYMDQFGTRYRAGYARRYDPRENIRPPDISDEAFRNRSNLHYVTQPGYNYDRPRQPGEGNDWDEPV